MNYEHDISGAFAYLQKALRLTPALAAYIVYRILSSLPRRKDASLQTRIATSGASAGKSVAAMSRKIPLAKHRIMDWIRHRLPVIKTHIPVAIAMYVLLAGLLVSFGRFSGEAMLIGCPAVALAASFLWNHYHIHKG